MPRRARLVLTGVPHHIVARGVNKQSIFRSQKDKRRYIDLLAQLAVEEQLSIHGYILMTNHVHLILTPKQPGALAKLLQRLHTRWAMYFNKTNGRTGHLFESRYYSAPLAENHFWNALRYVEMNAHKSGWKGRLEEWIYSSAKAHLSGIQDPLLELDWEAWQHCFGPQKWREFLDDWSLAYDEALKKALAGCRPIGPPEWIAELEQTWHRKLTCSPPGRPKKQTPLTRAAA